MKRRPSTQPISSTMGPSPICCRQQDEHKDPLFQKIANDPNFLLKRTKSMKTPGKSGSACVFNYHLARFEPSSPSSTSAHRMSLRASDACTSACAGRSPQRRNDPAWTLPEEKRFIQQKNFLPHRKCNNRFPAAIFDKIFRLKLRQSLRIG